MPSVAAFACAAAFAVATVAALRTSTRDHPPELAPRPALVEAAAVGASLRLAALVPIVAWAAEGALGPAMAVALAWVVGVQAGSHARPRVRRLRPISSPVRVLVAIVLATLMLAEAMALAVVLEGVMPGPATVGVVVAALGVGVACGALAGAQRPRRTINALLGPIAFGVFGIAMLALYANLSALASPSGDVVVAQGITLFAAIGLLASGRTRFVDTHADEGGPPTIVGRVVRRSAKLANVVLSTMLGVCIVLAAMSLARGIDPAALQWPALVPHGRSAGLVAMLVVLAVIGGFVVAIARPVEPAASSRRTRTYEPALVVLLAGAGALIAASDIPAASDGARAWMRQLARQPSPLDTAMLAGIVLAACACATAAFTSTFAMLRTLRSSGAGK